MATASLVPSQIAGYNVLSLALPPLPSFPTGATHYLYVCHDQPKMPTPTSKRSLFLANVPFDATILHLKQLFSQQLELPAGRIEDVRFESRIQQNLHVESAVIEEQHSSKKSKKRKRGTRSNELERLKDAELPSTWDRDLLTESRTAVIQFVDKSSTDAALKAVKVAQKEKKLPVWGEGLEEKVPALGFARYLEHDKLTYPDKSVLLESVNNYMTAFAAMEASQAAKNKKQRQDTDADGFITVTRGGRTNPGKQEAAKEQAEKQQEKRKGLEGFYRFQSREKKKQRAGELIKKFEEDQEKVRKMKARRGMFQPK